LSIISLIASWSSDRREIKALYAPLLRFDTFVEVVVLDGGVRVFPVPDEP
jgi:hypothetical protein